MPNADDANKTDDGISRGVEADDGGASGATARHDEEAQGVVCGECALCGIDNETEPLGWVVRPRHVSFELRPFGNAFLQTVSVLMLTSSSTRTTSDQCRERC